MFGLIAIAPLVLASIIAALLSGRNSRYAGPVTLAGSLGSLALILYITFGKIVAFQQIVWFSIKPFTYHIAVSMLPFNLVLLWLVGIITPLILLYSIGFISVNTEKPRFYFEMGIFAAAMMVFAMSANFITMFIGWEMLGITSYLLIGFWYGKEKAPTAARKAITTVIIGDIAMLSGMLLIWVAYGTFNFSSIIAAPESTVLPIAMGLILVAIFTKSAQFPFHEWLADAMEGPTPVSAFLHSSTMVKAGVFLAIVLFPLFLKAGLLEVILAIGLISAFIGASNAISSHHIKRILAYSTIEDLGLMFVAVGMGAIAAAILFFIVQAFYKALLFMSAGSIMRANGESEDIYKSFGSRYNKLLYIPMLIGVLSIAGIFPLSGFFGKVAIETSAQSNIYVYLLLLVIDFATSAYIFRWIFLHSRRAPLKQESGLRTAYRDLPKTMLIAGATTSAFVIIAAISLLYVNGIAASYDYAASGIGIAASIIESIAIAVGLFISYKLFVLAKPTGTIKKKAYYILFNSVAVNASYAFLAKAVLYFAEGIEVLDELIYGFFSAGGSGVLKLSSLMRKSVNGSTNVYIAALVAGIIIILLLIR
ncbi:hypothetical protein M1373_03340 [Candidatus Marsarchaeota archaeon]|nr:hypothetical protein [Candidatus Marsarchaeota archaeon]MCL5404779.1 hypothetical protein [Candidatus Marsarchaeota archaeon]